MRSTRRFVTMNCSLSRGWAARNRGRPAAIAVWSPSGQLMRTSPRGSDRLLGRFRFDYRCARVFKDLSSDLGQVDAAGRTIEEPNAEPLFEHCHPPTDARLGKPQRTGSGRETAMLDDGGEKLEVIKIPHHCPRSFPFFFGSFRRPPRYMIDRESGL